MLYLFINSCSIMRKFISASLNFCFMVFLLYNLDCNIGSFGANFLIRTDHSWNHIGEQLAKINDPS